MRVRRRRGARRGEAGTRNAARARKEKRGAMMALSEPRRPRVVRGQENDKNETKLCALYNSRYKTTQILYKIRGVSLS